MKGVIYYILGFILSGILISANSNYKQIVDTKCFILKDNRISKIKDLLDSSKNDTSSYHLNFLVDYSRKGYYLVDKKNKWELSFSDKYFDIEVEFLNDKYVIVYCSVSGIMNGLTSVPVMYNQLYIINRNNGEKILNILSKKGLVSAIIKDNILFFKCHKPDVVRYLKL
ncbi:MAG: hypothetical protein H7320_15955 [Ferruginibacter sp.]|nr:hypothetical protein [Ferruginibacter sp.]